VNLNLSGLTTYTTPRDITTGLVIRKMPCLPANYPGEVPGTTIIARRTRLPPRWKRR
jgi:hypothetical protein